MRRLLVPLAAFAAAAALAPPALGGGDASVTAVELGPGNERTLAAAGATRRFTLVGVHWRGPGDVEFRTRSLSGRWSGWRPAAPEGADGPDRGSRELRNRAGWRVGNPWWVGPSDRIETRTRGQVGRVRAYLVWSPEISVPHRVPASTVAPAIVPRLSWDADESIRRAPPSYADAVRFSVVHHTAGRNGYSRAEAPAIVKAIQLYHVKGNGWNDIGYNFLVDRFGTVYEGRFGGVERNVVGAHAQGFNTGSVGVAILGTYENGAPSRAAQDAIAKLLAWRLDIAHVDPESRHTYLSGGSNRFAAGVPVLVRAVSGHRDTGLTSCPGDVLYSRLNALAVSTSGIGLPKIYEPRVEAAEGVLRFRARLSSSATWVVAVADTTGAEVARGTGTGTSVDWSWDSTLAASGAYTWSIRSGSARPATGPLRVAGTNRPVAIQGLSALPATITPNADGQADVAVLQYRLTVAANVTVEVRDATGAVLATVVDRVWTRAGKHTATIDGATFPDGTYDVAVRARTAAGAEVEETVLLTVSRMLGLVSVTPSLFSPNGDGRNDAMEVGFSLTEPSSVLMRVLRDGVWVATPLNATYDAGSHVFEWDGIRRPRGRIKDGAYSLVLEASDPVAGLVTVTVPFVSDTTAPLVRLLPGRPLRVQVSEPSTLTLRIDGAIVTREVRKAGVVRITWSGAARRVRAVAVDAAGNMSRPVVRVES